MIEQFPDLVQRHAIFSKHCLWKYLLRLIVEEVFLGEERV
jgi:hypothetical protein